MVTVAGTEPWIAWFLSSLRAPEESLKSAVNAAQRFALNIYRDGRKSRVLAQFRQLSLLVVVGNSLLAELPGVAALLQGSVISFHRVGQNAFQFGALRGFRLQSQLKGPQHRLRILP